MIADLLSSDVAKHTCRNSDLEVIELLSQKMIEALQGNSMNKHPRQISGKPASTTIARIRTRTHIERHTNVHTYTCRCRSTHICLCPSSCEPSPFLSCFRDILLHPLRPPLCAILHIPDFNTDKRLTS